MPNTTWLGGDRTFGGLDPCRSIPGRALVSCRGGCIPRAQCYALAPPEPSRRAVAEATMLASAGELAAECIADFGQAESPRLGLPYPSCPAACAQLARAVQHNVTHCPMFNATIAGALPSLGPLPVAGTRYTRIFFCHQTHPHLREEDRAYLLELGFPLPGKQECLRRRTGPVGVAINASGYRFSFYSSGIFECAGCGDTDNDLNHAVLLVGYGKEDDKD